ncbi:MAG: aromatic ring-hydroxylating dioxygenase subunit alpha [Aphanocapsa lilacina HA4352-LM1]|nr:aromatic ring-hydroxylating dioxygenase subunit alpha [Aphanocapsa lilacina HA4352-LM1]
MTISLPLTSTRLGLPGRYYTDPDFYQRELKTVWRSTWQWVGRLEDLAGPGDYLTTILGEEPIFVVKNAEGELLAMHNVCPHRGARLLPEKQGSCKFLQCPYHAWTFDLEGKLLAVSQPKWFPDLDKSSVRLGRARVDSWGGFVFVNPDPEGESLAEYLAGYPEYLGGWPHRWEELREVARTVYEEPINWKFIVENYVEDYHFATAHAGSLVPLFDVQDIRTTPTGRHIPILVPYTPEPPADPAFLKHWEADVPSYQGFIFPNMMINTGKNGCSVWRVTALGPERSRLETVTYQTPAQYAADPYVPESWQQVMEEDFSVCRLLQRGVGSRAYQVRALAGEHELGVAHFHQVLAQYL